MLVLPAAVHHTVGTVFEDSKIPLSKWLATLFLMCSSKQETLESFRAVFEAMSYRECETPELESVFERLLFSGWVVFRYSQHVLA